MQERTEKGAPNDRNLEGSELANANAIPSNKYFRLRHHPPLDIDIPEIDRHEHLSNLHIISTSSEPAVEGRTGCFPKMDGPVKWRVKAKRGKSACAY